MKYGTTDEQYHLIQPNSLGCRFCPLPACVLENELKGQPVPLADCPDEEGLRKDTGNHGGYPLWWTKLAKTLAIKTLLEGSPTGLPVSDVAKATGIAENTIHRWITVRKLKGTKRNGRKYVTGIRDLY